MKSPKSIEDLQPAKYNPRRIDKEAASGLRASLDKFGDISGIVFNVRTGNLVAGHQRVEQLKAMGAEVVHEYGRACLKCGNEVFRIREVDWDESTEVQANITANNPHIAGVFTEELDDLLRSIQHDIAPEGFGELQLEKLMSICVPTEQGPTDADAEWDGMPDFSDKLDAERKIVVSFANGADVQDFAKAIGQKITDKTKSIWYPERERFDAESVRWDDEKEAAD